MELIKKLTAILLLATSLTSVAGFDEGLKAYNNKDYKTALTEFKAAADQGSASSQYALGVMYASGQGVKQDYAGAVKWYQKAADQGNASAQYNLGYMYASGQGVKQDYAEAVKWYQKAADQGDASAQYNLGYMYGNGQGVKQDYAGAVKWYQKAADQGDASAQVNLGNMYKNGQGVKQDYAEAVKLYQKAADQENADATNSLAVAYEMGQGVLQDYTKAVSLFKKAVGLGDYKYATRNIGLIHRDGKLGQANPIMAYIYLNLSAKYGHSKALAERDEVAKLLKAKEILKAQEVSANWKEGADIAEIKYQPEKPAVAPAPKKKESPPPKAEKPAPSSASNNSGDCRPRGNSIRCSSRCTNGDCIVTYENGCKIQVQVQPKFNAFTNQFEFPSPGC